MWLAFPVVLMVIQRIGTMHGHSVEHRRVLPRHGVDGPKGIYDGPLSGDGQVLADHRSIFTNCINLRDVSPSFSASDPYKGVLRMRTMYHQYPEGPKSEGDIALSFWETSNRLTCGEIEEDIVAAAACVRILVT